MKHSILFRLGSAVLLGLLCACQLTPTPTELPATLTVTPTAASVSATLPQTLTPTPPPALTPTPTGPAQASPTPGGPSATPGSAAQSRVVGYYFSGSAARGYKISDIPADQLDVVIYAFLGITPGGECFPLTAGQDTANFIALRQLKLEHPRLKVLFSVGGASHSTLFSDIAATDALRAHFAQNCVAFMKQNGFDGIDLDWEFPVSGGAADVHHNPADKQNFTALLTALRAQLDTQGASDKTHYLLTLAGGAGASEYANLELSAIAAPLDWIDVMAYSFAVQASPTTAFKSPLFAAPNDPSPKSPVNNADAAIKAYLAGGVPANKLVLGTGLYGRGWAGVAATNNGLYQADSGPSQGTWAKDGVYGYQDLATTYLPAYTRSFSSAAQVPWLYSPADKVFITYEDPQSLAAKADYVTANQLGGMMVWELSYDDSQHSLINVISSHLHAPK